MKKILVIEDNTEVRENLCEILDLADYETHQAENGKVGLQKAKELIPDLIICDVMMPELDGFGVLRIINRDPQLMHIPFMFLTAKAEKTDFRKGMGLGADDYITKPFDEVELLDALEMRLKKSSQLAASHSTDQSIRQFYNEAKAEEALRELSEGQEIRSYLKKSSIYHEDNYPKFLYQIISGHIKCARQTDSGKELITKVYGPGEFVGLVSLMKDEPYQESAVCTDDCEVKILPAEDFKLLMFNDRDFSAKFTKLLANHAGQTEAQLVDLAYSSVRKKVANALLAFAKIIESKELTVSREDIAAKTGTARETVIRTISDFKSEGLISIQHGALVILDKAALEEMPQ